MLLTLSYTCVKVNPKKPELTEGFMVREIGGSMAPLWSSLVEPGKTQALALPLFFTFYFFILLYVDPFVTPVLITSQIKTSTSVKTFWRTLKNNFYCLPYFFVL